MATCAGGEKVVTRWLVTVAGAVCALSVVAAAGQGRAGAPPQTTAVPQIAAGNAIANPYRMLEKWPTVTTAAAIGIVPDNQGGVWLQHRAEPGILHLNAAGEVLARLNVSFAFAHGLCRDSDGNFWAVDSGPFNDTPGVTGVKGNQVFKFDSNGKLLLTLGQAGVSRAGTDTFLQPTACVATPDGNILIADGHWPRPKSGPQDGDRLVWFTRDGKFVKQFGHSGTKPGEFLGPHGLAFDSRGRLFVADRSNDSNSNL